MTLIVFHDLIILFILPMLQEIIKEGVLNRTKITENNKKVRKNWSTAYVVLTQTQLLFFKDSKTYQAWVSIP